MCAAHHPRSVFLEVFSPKSFPKSFPLHVKAAHGLQPGHGDRKYDWLTCCRLKKAVRELLKHMNQQHAQILQQVKRGQGPKGKKSKLASPVLFFLIACAHVARRLRTD